MASEYRIRGELKHIADGIKDKQLKDNAKQIRDLVMATREFFISIVHIVNDRKLLETLSPEKKAQFRCLYNWWTRACDMFPSETRVELPDTPEDLIDLDAWRSFCKIFEAFKRKYDEIYDFSSAVRRIVQNHKDMVDRVYRSQ